MSSSEIIDGSIVGRDCASEPRLAKFSVVDDANRAMARFISETTALFGGPLWCWIDGGNRDIDQFGDAPPGGTAPACRVRDDIVDTGFEAC